jgi:serine/threonine-protein kinase
LACVLYEALTGDTPFGADSYEHLIASHISAPPPRASAVNPRVPAALDDVIARGMAKEPDDRYGSAGALGRAAQRALQTTGPADPPNANTMVRQLVSPPAVSAAAGSEPTGPMTGPTVVLDSQGDRPRQWLVPLTIVGVVAAVLLAAIGVVIGLLVSQNSGQSPSPTPAATPTPGVTVSTVSPTFSAAPASPPALPSTRATPAPVDPEVSSYQQLRQIADGDRGQVLAATQGADLWVPQLSSKRPGVFDEGHVWNNVQTLQEHLRLRQKYGALLLWSGDWSVFDASNFWVTIAPLTFTRSSDVLMWCTSNKLDPDHCYAKLISTTHGAEGSTAHN